MDGRMTDLALNERAWAIADDVARRAAELRVTVVTLGGGARVIDCGIEAAGGLGAGVAMAELCMGGLGRVSLVPLFLNDPTTEGGESWAGVQVYTDHPAVSCMASQYAGWSINPEGYFAMGSGPLRAKARVERELFEKLKYGEAQATRGVLVLETRSMPNDEVARWVADKAGIPVAGLTFVVAPTASVAGGVQIVARMLETGLHKMDALGFDVTRVESALGTAPLPPTAKNDMRAIGRTNDCILYGAESRYVIRADDAELEALAAKLPASSSKDYGTPFYDVFMKYDKDFYKIDPMLFSPAVVSLTSATSGRTFHAGTLNPGVLRKSLWA
jgi:methenyltetrahydromethanopterin cyclohydrolase